MDVCRDYNTSLNAIKGLLNSADVRPVDVRKSLVKEQVRLLDTYVEQLRYLLNLKIKSRNELVVLLRALGDAMADIREEIASNKKQPAVERQLALRLQNLNNKISKRVAMFMKRKEQRGKTLMVQGRQVIRQITRSLQDLRSSISLKSKNNKAISNVIDSII